MSSRFTELQKLQNLNISEKLFVVNKLFRIITNVGQAIFFCHKQKLSLGYEFDSQHILSDVNFIKFMKLFTF